MLTAPPLRTFSITYSEMRKMTEAGFLRIQKPLLTLGVLLSLCGFALGQDAPGTASAEWSLLAAFAFVVLGGILANVYLVGLFHAPRSESSGAPPRWAEKWEFSPHSLGGFSWRQLSLWSLLTLFLELLMIRWISSEIRVFAYFRNFVLIACSLGFGLGATFLVAG